MGEDFSCWWNCSTHGGLKSCSNDVLGLKNEHYKQYCQKMLEDDFCHIVNCDLGEARKRCPKQCKEKQHEWKNIGAGFCMDAFGSYFNDLETNWQGSGLYDLDECKEFCEKMGETCVGIVFRTACSLKVRNGITEEDAKALVPNFRSVSWQNNFHYSSTGG